MYNQFNTNRIVKCIKLIGTITLLLVWTLLPVQAQNFPHIKTFGFDYGYPQNKEDLNWLATHHDAIIGAGDWQTKKMTEFQYDTLHAANPDILLLPYVVSTAYTFKPMENFMRKWAEDHNYDPEELYIHYYSDNVVKTHSTCVAKGEGLSKCCDKKGMLLGKNQTSHYFLSKGYGGGTAASLKEARTFQFWNSGFRPKMNPLSEVWEKAYRAYILDVITINSSAGKYCDGVFVDSYGNIINKYGNAPNVHQLIELRKLGYGKNDTSARQYFADIMAQKWGKLGPWLEQQTKKSKIYIVPNIAELNNIYKHFRFAIKDQFHIPGFNSGAIEYLSRPTGTGYWQVKEFFKQFYDDITADRTWFCLNDTVVKKSIGRSHKVISALIGGFYLFNHPNVYWGFHYGSPGYYNKQPTWADSHWHPLLEYDIGVPVNRSKPDLWGKSNTNRMYVIEKNREKLRYVLAREYSKALVIVRYDSYIKWNDAGKDQHMYQLPGNFQLLQENNTLGPVVNTISLGKAEGAILIKSDN